MHTALCACVVIICFAAGTLANDHGDTFYVTANNFIDQVCINAQPYPNAWLPNRLQKTKLDQIPLSSSWGMVNIKARRRKGRFGVLGYLKTPALQPRGIYWTCKPVKLIPYEDCCMWDGRGGGVSFQSVQRPYSKLIPEGERRVWVWSAAPWNRVCCKVWPCAPYCNKCKEKGAWQCDKGRCTPGTRWNRNTMLCDRCCRIKVISWPSGQAIIISTDELNQISYQWPLQDGNAYITMIDPKTCKFLNPEERPAATASELTTVLANWNLGTDYINYVSVEVKVNTETSPGSGIFLTLVFVRWNQGNGNPANTVTELTGPLAMAEFYVYYPIPAFWLIEVPWFKTIQTSQIPP